MRKPTNLIDRCRSHTVALGIAVVLVIILGCATTGPAKTKRPDWVSGSSSQYPSGRYLTGVGYGEERQVAEDKARAEIAKVFVARIEQRSYEFEQYLQIAAKGKVESAQTVDIRQVTAVSTEKVLSGVTIVDHYIDKASHPPTHYALAALNRQQAQNSLREKIDETDREIAELAAGSDESPDTLKRIQLLKQAIAKSVLREALNEELRVVNPQGTGQGAPISLKDLKAKLAAILKDEFNLAVTVSGPYQAQIEQALTEGLTRLGFVISPDSLQAIVLIKGAVDIVPADVPHARWKFVRWSVDFQLIDRRDGKIFGSINSSGKEGHLTASEAEKKAVRTMQEKLSTDVGEVVSEYIFGQY